MRVVVDTNVLVAALLSPRGPSGRILDLLTEELLIPLYDGRILDEYREVLSRREFGFSSHVVEALLEHVETIGQRMTAVPVSVILPDKDDQAFLEVAIAGHAEALITGNLRHFPSSARLGVRVVDPATFLAQWRS